MIEPKQNHYGAIMADPAWSFATRSPKGRDRCPDSRHYDVMPLEEIKALPVQSWAAPDSALFLWVTDPMLLQGIEVLQAWGFTYKTVAFTWAKTNRVSPGWAIGTGYWSRANPEMCLLGTRGKPKRLARDVRQLIVEPRREHSRKPDCTRSRVQRLVGGPYLEMFARQQTPGWDTWGNQTDRFPVQETAVGHVRRILAISRPEGGVYLFRAKGGVKRRVTLP